MGERSYDIVAVDPADYRKKREFIQSLTFNLIVLAKPGQKLVKGSDFVRSALKSNYIVINPHTKELCVSFCIANDSRTIDIELKQQEPQANTSISD